ncbi:gliding motility-associated C-terminal domain-containing protein [Winogradskyella sp. R77965]|uniref:gliding motility-associated C-terminal domain-containing protein n=1 Tax=Winogradskyella sp. R77965 TaxID=3093872 RepID=UPI0037DDB415
MLPNCTTLTLPLDGSIDVPVNTDFSWNPVSGATGYRINIGDNVNFYGEFDVGNNLTFDLGFDLPENELIFVRIIPYNGLGDAIGGCTNESFTTGSISALPICTQLLAPLDLNVNVSPDTDLTWVPEPNATGYRLSVGTISNGTDILDNVDVGNFTTYDILGDLPENTDIFVLIIPYNDFGDAEGCTEEYFTTGSVNTTPEDDNTKYGFSPDGNGINDYWHIDGIENHPNNVVTIYNRWGDLVFQIRGYDNYARAFRGEANKKTNMGAGKLPSGTYFFHIIIDGEHHLKKTKGFVVIKR